MARKYSTESSSDDSSPELDDFINTHVKSIPTLNAPKLNPTSRTLIAPSPSRTTQRSLTTSSPRKQTETLRSCTESLKTTRKTPAKQSAKDESVRGKPALLSTHLKPLSQGSLNTASMSSSRARATPHRKAKEVADYGAIVDLTADTDEEEESEVDESSIWCGSDAESEVEERPREGTFPRLSKLQLPRRLTPDTELSGSESDDLDSHIFKSKTPKKGLKTYQSPTRNKPIMSLPGGMDYSDKENNSQKSATVFTSEVKYPDLSSLSIRPSTPPPPTSPTKSKLVSPSKKKARIPTPPHRPSLDAFWNPHTVNDWNDQYSPQKPVTSPRKNRFLSLEDSSDSSPPPSPRKSQSPTKRTRVEMDARKDFESRKHQLCEDFLAELDARVTDGKIKELAASTGGVRFVWSKTLNTTAGRANWKKDTKKIKHSDGTVEITYKHHASIELAEKVIDDEERLLNVVAHEFCHLANFMVSGIKDQPHGRQFKAWGAKTTKAFGHRGVEVTTKHSYKIDYKYIWACTAELCGQEFKRHSKSIDPAKHTCGVCRSKIVQVKPVPRAATGGKAAAGTYAAFVKENFATIKKEMAGAPHKDVMTVLGQRYREQKAAAAAAAAAVETAPTADMDEMAKALEVVTLN